MTKRPAFTLIELLVVTAIFSLAVLLATAAYTDVQTTQRFVQAQQRLASEARYLVETISRSVRTGSINYVYYRAQRPPDGGPSMPELVLTTIDQQGVITCYSRQDGEILVATPVGSDCSVASVSNVTPSDMNVTALNFYITPRSDPFGPPPQSAADCKAGNFNASLGACLCSSQSDCWPGQTCPTAVDPNPNICVNPDVQPQVTIYLSAVTVGGTAVEQANVDLQTTVVSRVYQR